MTQTQRPKELWDFTALVDVIDDVRLFLSSCFRALHCVLGFFFSLKSLIRVFKNYVHFCKDLLKS